MMNEETNEQAISFAVQVGKLSAAEIKKALKYLIGKIKGSKAKAPKKGKEPEIKHGKQTLKQLQKQGGGLTAIELKDPDLRRLQKAMKKDGVDFAAVKDGKGKYTLFFKARDADTMAHAFKRYTEKLAKIAKVANKKPSIGAALTVAKQEAQALNANRDKVKHKEQGAR